MTRQEIIDAMFRVLSEKIKPSGLERFQSDARLLEDLGLDSSQVLQMLMFLELDNGLDMPEDALMNKDFETVRSVAQIMYEAQDLPKVEKGLEVYEDLKIHCVASCLSEIVKRNPALDHRILYFAVWDAQVCVNDRYVLSYHDDNIKHDFFFDWYEKLYGMRVMSWYDRGASKDENIAKLCSLVSQRRPGQHIMVMLDMHHLPERVNEFNKDPFPHYVMLGPTHDPELWFMYDPDYRWEGVLRRERILEAVRQPSVAGGYFFSDRDAQPSRPEQVSAYFDVNVKLDHNPVTDAIRSVVRAHVEGLDKTGQPLPLDNLMKAVEEVPVMSPRKYAYEHGFAFFWRELGLDEAEFDQWCDVIDELAKTYKLIQYQAMKLSATRDLRLADKIFTLLDQQDQREFTLKKRLREVKQRWYTAAQSASTREAPIGVE